MPLALCSVFSIKDPEERLAAVQGVVDGPLGTRLERLDKMLVSRGGRSRQVVEQQACTHTASPPSADQAETL